MRHGPPVSIKARRPLGNKGNNKSVIVLGSREAHALVSARSLFSRLSHQQDIPFSLELCETIERVRINRRRGNRLSHSVEAHAHDPTRRDGDGTIHA
ncbi:hypothetical protein EVAR_27522_1 [Eumeta japonica]|uniref:Uncharacterized protein n=1 Tax=Eumeta variegata TaxID=151549 RepID=A0A4C1W6Q7_EUMVA|nr:hypothetical protein EVAR_27522_1 [Eumeta japonica]